MPGPTYYAVVNDLIGGYDVSIHNKTVGNHGEDEWTIGSFMSQEGAEEVAHALNAVQAIADAPTFRKRFVEHCHSTGRDRFVGAASVAIEVIQDMANALTKENET